MALQVCKECGTRYAPAAVCPQCGHDQWVSDYEADEAAAAAAAAKAKPKPKRVIPGPEE